VITTKFGTVIKTIKFSLWVFPKFDPQTKIADSRHIEKMDKFLYFSKDSTDLDEILHADAHWPSEPLAMFKKSIFKKSEMADCCHFEKN